MKAIKAIKQYWLYAILIILLLSAVLGPCNEPKDFKEDKKKTDNLKAQLVKMGIENQRLTDSLVAFSKIEKIKTDSFVALKKRVDKELQKYINKAALLELQYTRSLNNKDTSVAIVVCDSVIEINKNLIAINEYDSILFDSTIAGYERQLSAKDNLISEQSDYAKKVRQSFDELKGNYDSLYGYHNKFKRKMTFNLIKQKTLAVVALAGVTYFLIDNIR